MINLDLTRKSSSSRGRKYFKQSVSSFNKFQDFLVAKSKQKHKPAFFADRPSMTGEVKIQKLNFSHNSSSNEFLPPKSIDKFSKSSTNRSGFTVPRQQILMSHTQTPLGKAKIWSFESTNEEYVLRPQEIKAKIQSNAMERFQELFKKETNLRAKRIEEEQSRRLMKLLENTSRKNHDAKTKKNAEQSQNSYLNYGNVSKKRLNNDVNLIESTNILRDVDQQQTDAKIKLKQSIKNSKVINPGNQAIDKDNPNKSQTSKQAQILQNKRKNSFFKDKNSVQLANELNKKTINVDSYIKNAELPKEKPQKSKDIILKIDTQQSESSVMRQEIKEEKPKVSIKKSQPREQSKKSQLREQSRKQIQKEQVKVVENKQEPKIQQKLEKKKVQQQNKIVKEESRKQQYNKKNSFKTNQVDIFESLPSAQMIEKIPEPSIKQIHKTKPEEKKSQNIFNQKDTSKEQLKTQDQQKGKISLEQIMKNGENPKQKTQQQSVFQSISASKAKTPITIKGAKQVKSNKNQPAPSERNRHRTNQEDDNIEEIEDVTIISRGASQKNVGNVGKEVEVQSEQINGDKKISENKPELKISENKAQLNSAKLNTQSNNMGPSTTSLANNLQGTKQTPTVSPTKPAPQSSSRVEFNDSSQQHCPADELGYLLDLVQTLGSYYTDSKHFYSQPESSMVEILMNHKIAAYFLAQQYYFYISLFKQCAEAQEKDQFYSLTKEEFEEALQDQEMVEGIEELKKSSQLAVKLIKMTFQKCKMYLKKHQKQLTISHQFNYHKQCLYFIKAQFSGLYKIYSQKATSPLGKRLCYLIETYCLVMYLNQEEIKDYQDVQDIEPHTYPKHIAKYKHILSV